MLSFGFLLFQSSPISHVLAWVTPAFTSGVPSPGAPGVQEEGPPKRPLPVGSLEGGAEGRERSQSVHGSKTGLAGSAPKLPSASDSTRQDLLEASLVLVTATLAPSPTSTPTLSPRPSKRKFFCPHLFLAKKNDPK